MNQTEETYDVVGEYITNFINKKFSYDSYVTETVKTKDQKEPFSSQRNGLFPLISRRNVRLLLQGLIYFLSFLCKIEYRGFLNTSFWKRCWCNTKVLVAALLSLNWLKKVLRNEKTKIARDNLIALLSISLLVFTLTQATLILFFGFLTINITFFCLHLALDIEDFESIFPLLFSLLFSEVALQPLRLFWSYLSADAYLRGRHWNGLQAEQRWKYVTQLEAMKKTSTTSLNQVVVLSEDELLSTKSKSGVDFNKYLYHNLKDIYGSTSLQHQSIILSPSSQMHFESMDFVSILLRSTRCDRDIEKKRSLDNLNVSTVSPKSHVSRRNSAGRLNGIWMSDIESEIQSQLSIADKVSDAEKEYSEKVTFNSNGEENEGILSSGVLAKHNCYEEAIELVKPVTPHSNDTEIQDTYLCNYQNSSPTINRQPHQRSLSFGSIDTMPSPTLRNDSKVFGHDNGNVKDWVDVGTRIGFRLLNNEADNKKQGKRESLEYEEETKGNVNDGTTSIKSYNLLKSYNIESSQSASSLADRIKNENSSLPTYPNIRSPSPTHTQIGVGTTASSRCNSVDLAPHELSKIMRKTAEVPHKLDNDTSKFHQAAIIPVHSMWTSPSAYDNVNARMSVYEEENDIECEVQSLKNKHSKDVYNGVAKSDLRNYNNSCGAMDIVVTGDTNTTTKLIASTQGHPSVECLHSKKEQNDEEIGNSEEMTKTDAFSIENPLIRASQLNKRNKTKEAKHGQPNQESILQEIQHSSFVKKRTKILPGCKIVVPIFSSVQHLSCHNDNRKVSKYQRGWIQMATVISCRRIHLPEKKNPAKSSAVLLRNNSNIQSRTNCLSVHVQLDKSFLRKGKFAQMHIRLPDDCKNIMPRHSCYPIGACVATSFGLGVLVGWRVLDDVHIVRSLWRNPSAGRSLHFRGALAYLQRNSIHGIVESAVGFRVETTRGRGKVLGYVNGGRQHMKGRYYVLIKESGRHKGHVLELNRSDILSCPSAKFIPVIEQIRDSALYIIQLDTYNHNLRNAKAATNPSNQILSQNLNGFNNFQWSEELDIILESLIKAVGEDPHFDSEVDIITSYLISFLEGSDIDVTRDSQVTPAIDISNDTIQNKMASLSGVSSPRESGLWFMNDLFGGLLGKDNSEVKGKESIETKPSFVSLPNFHVSGIKSTFSFMDDNKKDESLFSSNSGGHSTERSAEGSSIGAARDNYDRAYTAIQTLKRAVCIAQVDLGAKHPNTRLLLSVVAEFLVFIRTVIKVRQHNVSQEVFEIRQRTLRQMKEILLPLQRRLAKVGKGLKERLERHGMKLRAQVTRLLEILLQDDKMMYALEHSDWGACLKRMELAIIKAKILDSESCARYREVVTFIFENFQKNAMSRNRNHDPAAFNKTDAAAARSGEKLAWFAKVMKWIATPRRTILKHIIRDEFLELLERVLVRVFKDNPEAAHIINIYASNFRSARYFRMLFNLEMSEKLWIPLLDAANEEFTWAVSRMPEKTKDFLVPISKLFSLGVANFHEIRAREIVVNWIDFLMDDPARGIIHDLDMKIVLGIEEFCNDVKELIMILPYYSSIDEDILHLLDEVDLQMILREAAEAIVDVRKFTKYIQEKTAIAVDGFLRYLPKMSIPIEKRDLGDGWVITCRGKLGGDLTLSDVSIEKENLVCRVLGSGNVFEAGSSAVLSLPFSVDDVLSRLSPKKKKKSPTQKESTSSSENKVEISVLDHVRDLLLNAQQYGCWRPGHGGVSTHSAHDESPLRGIPMSEVLHCAIDLWRNLEIDDDELMEIVIKDISFQIEKNNKHDMNPVLPTPTPTPIPPTAKPSRVDSNSDLTQKMQTAHHAQFHRFNPRIDPTVIFLDLRRMTFELEDFLFRIEPKQQFSIFDPIFEGCGTLTVSNTSIKARVECRKERIIKFSAEQSVPVLHLQELDVALDKVKFKFKETGADWILNKVVSNFGKNITEIVEINLKEQIVKQIHRLLEHVNAFIEVNPDLMLKVLGITMDDLEENMIWV